MSALPPLALNSEDCIVSKYPLIVEKHPLGGCLFSDPMHGCFKALFDSYIWNGKEVIYRLKNLTTTCVEFLDARGARIQGLEDPHGFIRVACVADAIMMNLLERGAIHQKRVLCRLVNGAARRDFWIQAKDWANEPVTSSPLVEIRGELSENQTQLRFLFDQLDVPASLFAQK